MVRQVILFLVICIACPALLLAQNDSGSVRKDTLVKRDTVISKAIIPVHVNHYDSMVSSLLIENKFLQNKDAPSSLAVSYKKTKSADALFYLLAALLLLLAVFRFFFARYFSNLFRVFFNSSLRQGQFTDQLLQAKLPSLLFNIFFILCGGMYSYFILLHYQLINDSNWLESIALCVGLVGLVYFSKFCILKFTGWVTGFHQETDTYVFVLFLINKIIGIILVPFIVIIAFSESYIVNAVILTSFFCLGSLLVLRFFKSYGLLQHQLKISRFHFFLYLVGIEILPLLLIYKGLVIYLNKNL